jgi:cytochrome c556
MSSIGKRRCVLVAGAALIMCLTGFAAAQPVQTPAQMVEYRQSQFRRLGAAFKAVNDQARASNPDTNLIRANAQTISALAEEFPAWFTIGSGPAPDLDTKAKSEIWSNAVGFSGQVAAFQNAAQILVSTSAGSDPSAVADSARSLGQRCASCHTLFRERS